jgi:hypothetical protein
MSKQAFPQDSKRLFDKKEELVKEEPWLSQYYGEFLRKWNEYIEYEETLRKVNEQSDYLVFGASFKESS